MRTFSLNFPNELRSPEVNRKKETDTFLRRNLLNNGYFVNRVSKASSRDGGVRALFGLVQVCMYFAKPRRYFYQTFIFSFLEMDLCSSPWIPLSSSIGNFL